ncbi:hypothetical protein [Nocardioides sp. zg-DK7169]|uniref:hypothetical protein n=1 Tax=Nocardioides sp. zg-DK7169 TaxID=2736600 RepID=UPI0015540DEA|nr:hypothetical protein [Nocardioides sp. zg-DK7169]NPC96804.1 hypothetical protein [Nocardioides sp. zg-DK7169]
MTGPMGTAGTADTVRTAPDTASPPATASAGPPGLRGWWQARSRGEQVLLGLVVAHLVLKLVVYLQVAGGQLVGDESSYVNGAMSLSNLLRDAVTLTPPDLAEVERNVVGSGWFMPGMSLLLAPLYLVVPDADVAVLRAYLAVVTSVVFLLTVLRVRRVLGVRYAAALLVVPGLVPTWAAFSMAAWGDLFAGVLVVLLLMELVVLSRRLRRGEAPSLGEGFRLGLVAIAVVYFRSSTSLLVAGLGVVALVAAVSLLRGAERRRAVVAAGVGALTFVGLLLPWSVAASATLGGRVMTTTSVPTVLANTFGDREQVCFGPCDPGSTAWFSPLRYSRETARATGLSEMDVATQMSAYARQDVTASSYAEDVLDNLHAYVREPERFSSYLRPDAERADAGGLATTLDALTRGLVWAAFAVGVATILLVLRRRREAQVVSVLLTLSFGALLTQPFVHIAGPRYWTTAAPVLGLAAALLVTQVLARRAVDAPLGARDAALGTWLTRVQVLLAVGAVLVAICVPLVASAA